ncbi:MAG: hypothetical protein M1324_00165 [Patescibacteria group bacterium]|nr:hypothetical protein [Patescibacteria group bacterium]
MTNETGGYQPTPEEMKMAEEMMTPEQAELSRERERWGRGKEYYNEGAEKVENYLNLPPEKKAEGFMEMDDDTLQGTFGEGLPLNYVYHEFDGLTCVVAPHDFFTKTGMTLVDSAKSNNATPEQIEAAQDFVTAYEQNSQRIIAKSPALQKLLEPLKPLNDEIEAQKQGGILRPMTATGEKVPSKMDEQISDEELQALVKALGENDFWIRDSKVLKEKTRGNYLSAIEPSFGKLFRRFAIQTESPEEFANYKKQILEAYDKLIDTGTKV